MRCWHSSPDSLLPIGAVKWTICLTVAEQQPILNVIRLLIGNH